MRYLFVLLTWCISISAAHNDPYVVAVTEGEPSANIFNSVNVITGQFFTHKQDLLVRGAEPIPIRRTYMSMDGTDKLVGWSFQPHLNLTYLKSEKLVKVVEPNGTQLYFTYSDGYRKKKHRRKAEGDILFTHELSDQIKGLTNCGRGGLSGRNNLKNMTLTMSKDEEFFYVHGQNGTERTYQIIPHQKHKSKKCKYHLISERLSNGNVIRYEYDKERRIKAINSNNPNLTKEYASVQFTYPDKDKPDFYLHSSDQKDLSYRYKPKNHDRGIKRGHVSLLSVINSSEHPEESIRYYEDESVRYARTGGSVFSGYFLREFCGGPLHSFGPRYYWHDHTYEIQGKKIELGAFHIARERVRALFASTSPTGETIPIYEFIYHNPKQGLDWTEVFDQEGNRTNYFYSLQLRLEEIERYSGRDKFLCKEKFVWGRNDGPDASNLICRIFFDDQWRSIMARTFRYDEWGNVLQETLWGNLSGLCQTPLHINSNNLPDENGIERYSKYYTYNDQDLLLTESEDNGRGARYTYLHNTDLITSKLTLDHGQIRLRDFNQYNQDNILVRKISDDGTTPDPANLTGVTERRITEIIPRSSSPFYGMPEVIIEKVLDLQTNQELLVSKTILFYTQHGQIDHKDIYDSSDTYRYTLHYKYDKKGHLIEETNAIGQIAKSTYNHQGLKATLQDFHGQTEKRMHYDKAGRLIQLTEKGLDGNEKTQTFSYNPKGHLIRTTDAYNHTTTFTHDALGHELTKESPLTGREQKVYNSAGQVIQDINAKGEITYTQYNTYGKPTHITHPNGSTEQFIYNLDGTLYQAIDPAGTITEYTYDFLGRTTSKRIQNNLDTFEYNSFHLLSRTDPSGHTISYTYDPYGRKQTETSLSTTYYSYDLLGNLHIEQRGDLLKVTDHNLLGQVTSESLQNSQGAILTHIQYTYDCFGNKQTIQRVIDTHQTTDHFLFDSFNRPICQVDALGQTYHIEYQNQGLVKILTDPKGLRTIETYDPLQRKIREEKRNAFNELLSLEEYTYDPLNNLTVQHSTIVSTTKRHLTTTWDYGPGKRLHTLTEASGTSEQRTTRTTYNSRGQVDQLLKPDGTTLTHTYNDLGQLSSLTSSDGTIYYTYTYDPCGRLSTSTDENTRQTTRRFYNAEGQLTQEVLASGLTLLHTYDPFGRRIKLTLPDDSAIAYTYDAYFLRSVSRLSPTNTTLYTHHYTHYDPSGNLIQEELIDNLGTLSHTYDPLARPTKLHSPHFTQTIDLYDTSGAILSYTTNNHPTNLTYNDLSQLTSEPSATYTYDSHYNRLSKNNTTHTLSQTNQLLSHYTYDLNGNPTLKHSDNTRYTYDALGRLTSAENSSTRTNFQYDSLHRRIRKTSYSYMNNQWIPQIDECYLYDQDNEIGAAHHSGLISQLRILGLTPKAEIEAIAFELSGKTYLPVHDLFGNVTSLISLSTRTPSEHYTYTAFGEHTILDSSHTPITRSLIRNPWRYHSKRYDTETDLTYFGRRYYDASTGRWLTPDPSGFTDSLNLYAYVLNNPLTLFDLYGLQTTDIFKSSIHFMGQILFNFFLHFVPIPGIQTLGMLIANLFCAVPNPLPTRSACSFELIGDPSNGPNVVFANGIRYHHEEAHSVTTSIHNFLGGGSAGYSHNNTQGFLSDLIEAAIGCLGFQTDASRQVASGIRKQLNASNRPVGIFATSQGGIDLKNALKLFTPEEKQRLHIRTFGSPVLFNDNDVGSLTHLVSSTDPLPWLNLPHQVSRLFGGYSHVQYLPSKSGRFEHSIGCETYQTSMGFELDGFRKLNDK